VTPFVKAIYKYVFSRRWLLLVTATAIALSLYLHLKASSSPMQSDEETWLKSFDLHKNTYPFSLRYFQNYSTIFVRHITGLTLKNAFYAVQYFLMLLLSLAFFDYLKKLQISQSWSLVGVILFLLSFPIVAAHFEPVHTWDDFWMYGFSILFLTALLKQEWLLSSVFFTLGCFAREQMLLFYPILLLEVWQYRKSTNRIKIFSSLLLSLLVYGIFYWLTYQPSDPKRWELITYNFADGARTADATISIWNSFGFMWLAGAVAFFRLWKKRDESVYRFCFWGAVILVPLTLVMGCFFTLVRETRILFPPFVYVIPLAVWAIKDDLVTFSKVRPTLFWPLTIIVGGIFIFVGMWLSHLIWPAFDYGGAVKLRRDFAGVNLGLALLYLSLLVTTRVTRE